MQRRIILSLLGAILASGAANAQGAGDSMMTMPEVLKKLEANGYTAFQEIDRDKTFYEVTATSPTGQFVEILVNGVDGQIVDSELED